MGWQFYGRGPEQEAMQRILNRGRWFFAKVTGRRRIGKTSLIQRALQAMGRERVFYWQVPDSGPAGVVSAVKDAMDTFRLGLEGIAAPRNLNELALLVSNLARRGYVIAIDEFQYFNRERLSEFASHLQREVDALSADAERVPGGLIVLGSIHTEMAAVLQDRSAPLYNRVTDVIELSHLEIPALRDLLKAHDAYDPDRLLFLWNLFEGVPKFYRDCYEQGCLSASRSELIDRMFFQSSSPLRTEADNWFLKELHGRYDSVLKIIARKPGCSHGDIQSAVQQLSSDSKEQAGGYIKVLSERYRMIERKVPIKDRTSSKRGRYYLSDNFLTSWLAALSSCVQASSFRPLQQLVQDADERLQTCEGHAWERLVAQLYEERGRKGIGDFALTERISGYWDSGDTELDFVALDENQWRLRIGTCKRNPEKLWSALSDFEANIKRFLQAEPRLANCRVERVAFAPTIPDDLRKRIENRSYIVQDLTDLLEGMTG